MRKRLYIVIRRYILLLAFIIVYYIINIKTGFYIPCIFNFITGYKCPGCGITHCIFAILQFRFQDAFISNPLVFIYLPFIVVYFIYKDYLYITNKKDKILVKIPQSVTIVLLVITIVFGIVRNIINI